MRKNGKKRLVVGLAVLVVLAALLAGGWTWHEQPSFCGAVCHKVMGEYVASWEDGGGLAQAHAEAASTEYADGVKCLDCHEPTLQEQIEEVQTYVTGSYRNPLAKVTFSDDFCFRCHDSWETVAAGTDGYVLDYSWVDDETVEMLAAAGYVLADHTDVNPHAVTVKSGADGNPHAGSGEHLQCSQCHSMHSGESATLNGCKGCHHSGTFAACATCHG